MKSHLSKLPPRLLVLSDDPVIGTRLLQALEAWRALDLVSVAGRGKEIQLVARVPAVRTMVDDTGIVLQVEDRGLGIPQAELDLLFRKFSVTSTRGTRGEKGSGLGLYIVSEFTKLHRGRVHVDSVSGRGFSTGCATLKA